MSSSPAHTGTIGSLSSTGVMLPLDDDSSSFDSNSSFENSELMASDILSGIPTKSADLAAVQGAIAASARKRLLAGDDERTTPATANSKGAADGSVAAGSASYADVAAKRSSSQLTAKESDARLWEVTKIAWNIISHCDYKSMCALMRSSHRLHVLATHDVVWKDMLIGFNMKPFLTSPISKSLYRYFLEDIISTKALHGRYTFLAADDDMDSTANIQSMTLLISPALLGQENHIVGRLQLLLTYRNDPLEVLQGIARFSVHRKCYTLCCSSFGSPTRGPVFTVAVATANKKWINQSQQNFEENLGGIRLIMAPVLLEGSNNNSQITEKDVFVVSRPPKKQTL